MKSVQALLSCKKARGNVIERPQLLIKHATNTEKKSVRNLDESYWKHRKCNKLPARYVPGYDFNAAALNDDGKVVLAKYNPESTFDSYNKDKLKIWHQGDSRETSVLKRNVDTWEATLSIKMDCKILKMKFDKHGCNLYALTRDKKKNTALKIFSQAEKSAELLWEEKDTIPNCDSLPYLVNDTNDTMVFINGKSLDIRSKKHTTDNSWSLFSQSFNGYIKGFSFLPDENAGFLVYFNYCMLRYELDHTSGSFVQAEEKTIELKHRALDVLASADCKTNIIMYSSKLEQRVEKPKNHTVRNVVIVSGVAIGAAAVGCTIL
jgi:hypothetical protein